MADFTNNNIQDTYQRVLQLDSDQIQDGTGSVVLSSTELSSIQAIGTPAIAATEWTQIKNIGSAQINATEWGYVASMQDVSTTANTQFARLSLNGSGGALDPILALPISASKNNPHIGVLRGSSMYFRAAEDPNNLEISFVSGLAADIAHIKNTGTLHNALGNAAADTANTASLASNLIGLNTSDILTTNTNQIISSLKTIYTSNKLFFRDTDIYLNSSTDGTLQIVSDNNVNIFGNNVKVFAPLTSSALWLSGSLSENVYINNGHISASGNISSSATSTGSFGRGFFDSKVGIGTTSPSAETKLHVYGNANNDVKLKIENDFSGKNAVLVVDGGSSGDAIIQLAEASTVKGIITYDGGTDVLKIINDGSTASEHLAISSSGNVGIGTFSPDEKLEVIGTISASDSSHALNFYATNTYRINDSGGTSRHYIARYNNTISIGNTNFDGTTLTGSLSTDSHITASGNISASGKIYGRQFEQIETNCAINFNGGHFAYLPLSNQGIIDSEVSTNININRVAVVPGKPVKSIIRATGNSLGNNTPYTMSYWQAKETEPATPTFIASVYADTDSSSNKDAIRFDWSSPNSGSTIDIDEGSRIWMSLSSSNSGNTGYIITHLWEWDYNS